MDGLKNIILLFFLVGLTVNAQKDQNFLQLGVGYNFVDDSGPRLNDYFNFREIWHAVPFPSRLSIGYYMINGFGFEVIGSYNEYDSGKIVDGKILREDQTYTAIDGKISYDLNKITGNTGWFDPYLMTGTGYTWIGAANRATFNVGAGFNIWFSNRVGFNLNSMGKWGLFTDEGTNHLQHSLGLIFRLGKNARTEDDDFEQEVVLEASPVIVKGPLGAIQEKETVMPPELIPIPENSKAEIRRSKMLLALESVPVVYYAFNSSYLTTADKVKVDQLVALMKEFPEMIIDVQAHADSRGPGDYNDWLAERRAQRIAHYVVGKGIPAERIGAKGFGERNILNHCINGVKCSENEHKENRRTAYVLRN